MFTTDREIKKRTPPVVFVHLKHANVFSEDLFTRSEIAGIFGNRIHRSQISRFQSVLGGIEPYQPINRDGVWGVYVFLCWRQAKRMLSGGAWTWKEQFQSDYEKLGETAFLEKYVYSLGGSREDCDRMIDEYLAKKNTKKFA